MQDRCYILDRIKTKQMSIEEFNFDKLSAPPLSAFLTPYDIADLRYIATSVKLSAKPDVKFKMIDDILKRRNMVKFSAGTNRVVYRHVEFNNILFKIAYDNIGMQGNPAEFRNQWLLKPFVAKTFEISPCGTVAIQERVNPIRSREEYFYIAEDVYTLLTEWIIGRYIMADIGSHFFLNTGIRSGFGVVLLDYSYLYELDGSKLFCTAPDPTSKSGRCDGVIDYDDGFNFLYCTKCGVRYKVSELAKHIENKTITLRKEGSKMKIRTMGGTGAVANNNVKKVDEVATRGSIKKVPTSSIITETPAPVVKKEVEKVEEPKVEITKVNEEVYTKEVEKEPAKSPISFGEKTENKLNDGRNYVFEIEQALKTIKECYNLIQIDQVKDDITGKIVDTVCEFIEDPRIIADKAINRLPSVDIAEFNAIYLNNEIDKLTKEELFAVLDGGDLKDFIKSHVDVNGGVEYIAEDDKWVLHLDLVGPEAGLPEEETVVYNQLDIELNIDTSVANKLDVLEEAIVNESKAVEKTNSSTYYAADIVDINTVKSNEPHMEVMLIDDNQGGYLYDAEGSLIVVDRIQEKDVSEITVTSKAWLDNIVKELEELKGEKITVDAEEEPNAMAKALQNVTVEE